MMKKLFCMLLALCMVLSYLPAHAHADEADTHVHDYDANGNCSCSDTFAAKFVVIDGRFLYCKTYEDAFYMLAQAPGSTIYALTDSSEPLEPPANFTFVGGTHTFSGNVYFVDVTIKSGNFTGDLELGGCSITGGTFSGRVSTNAESRISGGTFNYNLFLRNTWIDTSDSSNPLVLNGTVELLGGGLNNRGNLTLGENFQLVSQSASISCADSAHIWSSGVCRLCSAECSHGSYQDGKCTTCGMECTHSEGYSDTYVCVTCGTPCSHNYENGTCSICSAACDHADGSFTYIIADASNDNKVYSCCGLSVGTVPHELADGVCTLCGSRQVYWETREGGISGTDLSFSWDSEQYVPAATDPDTGMKYIMIPSGVSEVRFASSGYSIGSSQVPADKNCVKFVATPYSMYVAWYNYPCSPHNYQNGRCTACYATCLHTDNTNESTWTNQGNVHALLCSVCGGVMEKSEHSTSAEGDKVPSCSGLGYCTVCKSEYGTQLAHVPDESTGYCQNGCGTIVSTLLVTQNGTSKAYDDMDTIISDYSGTYTIKLLKDYTPQYYPCIEDDTVTLDLNGKALRCLEDDITLYLESGSLTIQDSSSAKTGSVVNSITTAVWVETGTLTVTGGSLQAPYYGIGAAGRAHVNISGDPIITGTSSCALFLKGTFTITGGTFNSNNVAVKYTTGLNASGGTFTITGGTFNAPIDFYCDRGALRLGINDSGTGASFPGGLYCSSMSLSELLKDGLSYWVDGKMVTIDDTQTSLSGGTVTVKETCYHVGSAHEEYICSNELEHYYTCTLCLMDITGKHVEGTPATCNSFAVCALCEGDAGVEMDPDNHASTATYYRPNDDGITHTLCHSCCDVPAGENANHRYDASTSKCPDCNAVIAATVTTKNLSWLYATSLQAALAQDPFGVTLHQDVSGDYELNSVRPALNGFDINGNVTATGGTVLFTNGSTNSSISTINGVLSIQGGDVYVNDGIQLSPTAPAQIKMSGGTLNLSNYNGGTVTIEIQEGANLTDSNIKLPDGYCLYDSNMQVITGSLPEKKILTAAPQHTHDRTFTITGNDLEQTITATCSNTDGRCTALTQVVTFSAPEDLIYNGEVKSPTVTGSIDGSVPGYLMADDRDPLNAGTYTATIQIAGQTAQITYTIAPRSIADGTAEINGTFSYNGVVHIPFVHLTIDNTRLRADSDYTISYSNNINAGEATATLTGLGNYSGTMTKTFTIQRSTAPLFSFPRPNETIFYGKPLSQVALNYTSNRYGTFCWETPDLVPDRVGQLSVDVAFYPSEQMLLNYKWEDDTRWDADRNALIQDMQVDVLPVNASYSAPTPKTLTYDGSDQALVNPGHTEDGTMLYSLNGSDFSEEIPTGCDAGKYDVSYYVEADENHNSSDIHTIRVIISPMSVHINAYPALKTFGEIDPQFTYGCSEPSVTLTGSLSREPGQDAGEYAITIGSLCTDDSNYTLSFTSSTFTITPKDLEETDLRIDTFPVYNGEEQSVPFATSEGLTYTIDFGATAVDAGLHYLTISGTGNYAGSVTKEWYIRQAPVTLTADDQTITYGSTINEGGFVADGLMAGHSVNTTLIPSTENVTVDGVIEFVDTIVIGNGINETSNYEITYIPGKLIIAPDTASVENLTAETVTSANEEDLLAYVYAIESADSTTEEWDDLYATCLDLLEVIETVRAENNRLAETVDSYSLSTVMTPDKDDIAQLITEIDAQLALDNLTEEEKGALNGLKTTCENLLAKIAGTQALIQQLEAAVKELDPETVNSADKDTLESIEEGVQLLIDSVLLTGGEAERLDAIMEQVNRMQETIIDVEEDYEFVTRVISEMDPETVGEPDADIIQDALVTINRLLDSKHLTESQRKELEETKADAQALLDALTEVDYTITKGDKGQWTQGGTNGLSFTADGDFNKFIGIEVDGAEVDETNYTAKSGSTVVTLKSSFLSTLAAGKHTITFLYTDGEVSGEFTILADSSSEGDGDETDKPEDDGNETDQPEDDGNETDKPEDDGNETNKPEDDGNETDKPEDDGNETDKPEDDGNETDKPEDDGNETDKPEDDGNETDKPEDDGNETDKPEDDGNETDKPEDDGNETDQPEDDGNEATKPEDNKNNESEKDSESKTPATGDNSNILLWIVLLGASSLGVAFVLVSRKKRSAAK